MVRTLSRMRRGHRIRSRVGNRAADRCISATRQEMSWNSRSPKLWGSRTRYDPKTTADRDRVFDQRHDEIAHAERFDGMPPSQKTAETTDNCRRRPRECRRGRDSARQPERRMRRRNRRRVFDPRDRAVPSDSASSGACRRSVLRRQAPSISPPTTSSRCGRAANRVSANRGRPPKPSPPAR